LERRSERDVQPQPDRRRPGRPQAEHRLPGGADPQERGAPLGQLVGDGQPDDVAVERRRPLEVGDREMGFEQSGRAHIHVGIVQNFDVSLPLGSGMRRLLAFLVLALPPTAQAATPVVISQPHEEITDLFFYAGYGEAAWTWRDGAQEGSSILTV